MNQKKASNFLILILLLVLSFGFSTRCLAQKYSDLQTRTTQSAVKRTAIYPSKYGMDSESSTKTTKKKKETFGDLIMKMVRILILVIALFLGVAAYVAKHKDKFKNIELPNALKKVPVKEKQILQKEETSPDIQTIESKPILSSRDTKIKELVFKFFEINK